MKINTDEYERYNVTSNTTTTIKDWWKVRTNVMFTRSTDSQPYRFTSGQYDAWFYLLRWPRWYPYATYEDKDFRSAVTDLKQSGRETVNTNYVRANVGTELIPIRNLSINIDYTFGLWNQYQKRNGGEVFAYDMFSTSPFDAYNSLYGPTHNRAVQTSRYTMSNIFKAFATYDLSIKDTHNFKFIAGMDAETRERLGHYSERRSLIDINMPEIALATGEQYVTGVAFHDDFAAAGCLQGSTTTTCTSTCWRLTRDTTGRHASRQEQMGAISSASAGWRISEEPFMQWATPALSNLKLRGSWEPSGTRMWLLTRLYRPWGQGTPDGS